MSKNSKNKINNSKALGKPKLLLHACCAPCSTAVYEQLADDYELTVYWYNPNIFPAAEHDKRLQELKRLSSLLNFDLIIDNDSATDHKKWLNYPSSVIARNEVTKQSDGKCQIATSRSIGSRNDNVEDDQQSNNATIKQLARSPEGGDRCSLCYQMRLEKVYDYATTNGFDLFSTTLTVSPYKNAPEIIRIGKEIDEDKFLGRDYKKNDGYRRSVELSKLYGLYRQNYCGCEFSVSTKSPRKNNTKIHE